MARRYILVRVGASGYDILDHLAGPAPFEEMREAWKALQPTCPDPNSPYRVVRVYPPPMTWWQKRVFLWRQRWRRWRLGVMK